MLLSAALMVRVSLTVFLNTALPVNGEPLIIVPVEKETGLFILAHRCSDIVIVYDYAMYDVMARDVYRCIDLEVRDLELWPTLDFGRHYSHQSLLV